MLQENIPNDMFIYGRIDFGFLLIPPVNLIVLEIEEISGLSHVVIISLPAILLSNASRAHIISNNSTRNVLGVNSALW